MLEPKDLEETEETNPYRIYLTKKREEELVQKIQEGFSMSEEHFLKRNEELKEYWELYTGRTYLLKREKEAHVKGMTTPPKFPWGDASNDFNFNFFSRITETLIARIMDILFSISPLYIVQPAVRDYSPQHMEAARKLQHFLDIYLEKVVKLRQKMFKHIFYGLAGLSWLKLTWRPATDFRRSELPFVGELPEIALPDLEVVTPTNLMFIPSDVSSQSQIWAYCHKEDLKWRDILRRASPDPRTGLAKYRPDRVALLKDWDGQSPYTSQTEGTTLETKTFPVWEILLWDEKEGWLIVDYFRELNLILNVIRYPLSYVSCPYVPLRLGEVPGGELWGIDYFKRWRPTMTVVELSLNQLMNALDILIKPPLVVSSDIYDALQSGEKTLYPGMIIPSPGGVTEADIFPFPLQAGAALPFIQQLYNTVREWLHSLTSVSEVFLGQARGKATATEVSQAIYQSGSVIQAIINHLLLHLNEIPPLIIGFLKQFLTEPIIVELEGDGQIFPIELTPEELNLPYIISIQGAPYMPSTAKEKETLMLLLQLAPQFIGNDPVKMWYLLDEVFKVFQIPNRRLILGFGPPGTEGGSQLSPDQMKELMQQLAQSGLLQTSPAGSEGTPEEMMGTAEEIGEETGEGM